MPEFFVPKADDAVDAEGIYAAVKAFVSKEMQHPIDDRRVFSLTYRHDGKRYHAEVGQRDLVEGEPVVAILKARNYGLYFVCTPNRGVLRGMPILVGEHDVLSVQDFDPPPSVLRTA